MIISCPACASRFQYEDARFGATPSKQFKCTACGTVFEFANPLLPQEERPASLVAEAADNCYGRDFSASSQPSGNASLVFLTGPKAAMSIDLINPTITIGRDSTDVATLDPETSSRHAMLEVMEDGTVWLSDLGSRNGTFTNGKAITCPTQLSDRQEFTCGNSAFMVVFGSGPA
jgi:predicted Zn finger-like uncharacterized protein